MKARPAVPQDIDAYLASFPLEVQESLQQVRKAIQKAAPAAEETIKYQMPTFMLQGNLVHFAAWKKHIGFYHLPAADAALRKELAGYAGPKGSLKFPLNQPIPLGLIGKLVKLRVQENLRQAAARRKQT